MSLPEFLPALNLATLVIVALIVAISFALFMRKRSNRHPMDTERGREIERQRAEEAESQQPRG